LEVWSRGAAEPIELVPLESLLLLVGLVEPVAQ
jgi:hypothetical protein